LRWLSEISSDANGHKEYSPTIGGVLYSAIPLRGPAPSRRCLQQRNRAFFRLEADKAGVSLP